jgi:hypothetical protein
MGRQKTVRDGKSRKDRQAGEYRRAAAALGGVNNYGHEEHEPDLKEHWHADKDAKTQQRPGHPRLTASPDQKAAERSCRAGARKKLPQDGAHAQNDGDMAHHFAGSCGECCGDALEGNARGNSKRESSDRKADGRVQAKAADEKQKEGDRASDAGQQISVRDSSVWDARHGSHAAIIAVCRRQTGIEIDSPKGVKRMMRWSFNLFKSCFV